MELVLFVVVLFLLGYGLYRWLVVAGRWQLDNYAYIMKKANEKYGTNFDLDAENKDNKALTIGGVGFIFGKQIDNALVFDPGTKKVAIFRHKAADVEVHDLSYIITCDWSSTTERIGPGGIQKIYDGKLRITCKDPLKPLITVKIKSDIEAHKAAALISAMRAV